MQQIKERFDSLIRHVTGIEKPKTDEIFEAWAANKADFIKMFGGQYIKEFGKITLTLPESVRRQKVEEFLGRVKFHYNNHALGEFIEANFSNFFENKVKESYGNIKVPTGMKLIKAFKFYEENEATLRAIQDEASMIIQEDRITGTFCMSVHPLDFMSLSENTYNWRSCHALDGEYCAGNISYMCDASTIICYIRGDEETVLPNFNFEWNNKKWRMLLHFSDNKDMMFAGRHYPFVAPEALYHIYDWLDLLGFKINRYCEWDNYMVNDMRLTDKYICLNRALYPMWDIVKDVSKLHYNDLLYSTCYQPYYSYIWSTVGRKSYDEFGNISEDVCLPQFHIGYEVKCLECGEHHIPCGEGTFQGECCRVYDDDYMTCDCCGRRYPYDDMAWINGGDACVCPSCLETETFFCPVCEQYWFTSDANYDEDTNDYYCPYCMDNIRENR